MNIEKALMLKGMATSLARILATAKVEWPNTRRDQPSAQGMGGRLC
jgi:hypothetical protein